MVLLKVKGRSGAAWRQGDLFNWRGTLRRAQGIRVARRQRRVKREGAEARRKSEGEEGISFSNGGARFVVTRGTGVAKRRRRVSRGGWRAGWLGLPARSRHWVNLKGGARKTEFFTRRRGGRGEDEEWIWRLDVRFLIIGGARFVVTWGRASRNGDGGFHAETRRSRRTEGGQRSVGIVLSISRLCVRISGVVPRVASPGHDEACPSNLRMGPPALWREARPLVRTERAHPVCGVDLRCRCAMRVPGSRRSVPLQFLG